MRSLDRAGRLIPGRWDGDGRRRRQEVGSRPPVGNFLSCMTDGASRHIMPLCVCATAKLPMAVRCAPFSVRRSGNLTYDYVNVETFQSRRGHFFPPRSAPTTAASFGTLYSDGRYKNSSILDEGTKGE